MYIDKFYEVNSSHSRTKYFSTLEKAHTYCKDKLRNFPVKIGQFWWHDIDSKSRYYKPLGCYAAYISEGKDFEKYCLITEYHITQRVMES